MGSPLAGGLRAGSCREHHRRTRIVPSQDQPAGVARWRLERSVDRPDRSLSYRSIIVYRYYDQSSAMRRMILVEAFEDPQETSGWRINYGFQETNPGKPGKPAPTEALEGESGLCFDIPLEQTARPGFKGKLRIEARPWK